MKILIFEDGGFTSKVLTHLITKMNQSQSNNQVTVLRGVQNLEGWVCFDQNLQTIDIKPGDYDLAIVDQNLHGDIEFTHIVAALQSFVPCFGLSSQPKTNAIFIEVGAKLALTKQAAFAGLFCGRIVPEQVGCLNVDDGAALLRFQDEVNCPTSINSQGIREATEVFMHDMIAMYLN